MSGFRESKGGTFFLEEGKRPSPHPTLMPPLRFVVSQEGQAVDPWGDDNPDTHGLLALARLDWRVHVRTVLMQGDDHKTVPIEGYRALVRPDTGQAMSVVSRSYHHAENAWVAETAVALGLAHDRSSSLVGAVGFGRDQERTLFVVRVSRTDDSALMLLTYNTHGGEGAIRFHLVEVEVGHGGAVLTPAVTHAVTTVPHAGDVRNNLRLLAKRGTVSRYADERAEAWERLGEAFWSPRHSSALISELWPAVDRPVIRTSELTTLRHPREHLTEALGTCADAASAYRVICRFMDNDSEARERGDFTKDRDERLALGAGVRHKQRAWQWIVANT